MIELVKELDVNAGAIALFDKFELGEQPDIECNQLRLAGGFGDHRLGWIAYKEMSYRYDFFGRAG